MKRISKTLLLLTISLLFLSKVYSNDVERITSSFNTFAQSLNKTIPNAMTQHNVYSEAWIGKLIPSLPPHFAVGIEGGVTKLDTSALQTITEILNASSIPSSLVFPTVAANVKIGGIFLPFDIGFSIMGLDSRNLNTSFKNMSLSYFSIGGDIRYAIIKENLVLPCISVGVGYYYSRGELNYSPSGANLGIKYDTHTMFASAQVSKTFLFFTPFVGFRTIISDTKSTWNWSVDVDTGTLSGTLSDTNTLESGYKDSFIPQLFGGFGLKFGFFEMTLNGSIDLRNLYWAAGFNARLKF